ncbi:DUF2931 family protein [Pseudomonas chlororaphis]|uniref:DUF2931 family protein n=1 Tax=Pseudomonas chlororaphis TaxID=587753 RepID=UPI00209A7733|nr:DUF2931 family protein [Pseudomonas chlororaphis]
MRAFTVLLGALLLTGCLANDPLSAKNDPKSPWWELGFTEPYYMEVWVEDSAVEDINGKLFRRTGRGTAAGGDHGYKKEWARGWDGVGIDGKSVVGADLPKRIFVRWQSVVEPQTYRVWIDIPEEARQIMRKTTARRCPETPQQTASYMASVNLGLAPGGIVQVWVRDECIWHSLWQLVSKALLISPPLYHVNTSPTYLTEHVGNESTHRSTGRADALQHTAALTDNSPPDSTTPL